MFFFKPVDKDSEEIEKLRKINLQQYLHALRLCNSISTLGIKEKPNS